MDRRKVRIILLLLGLSLLGNGWFLCRHFRNAAPAAAMPADPKLYLDADSFDFSKTGLSDDSFRLDPVPKLHFDGSASPASDSPASLDPQIDLPSLRDLPPTEAERDSLAAPPAAPPKRPDP